MCANNNVPHRESVLDELDELVRRAVETVRNDSCPEVRMNQTLDRLAQHPHQPRPRPRAIGRKSRILVMAAAFLVFLGVVFWLTTPQPTWAQVARTLQSKAWIHGETKMADGQVHEFWLSAARGISAFRHGSLVQYDDHRLDVRYSYDSREEIVHRLPLSVSPGSDQLQTFSEMFAGLFHGDVELEAPWPGVVVVQQSHRQIVEDNGEFLEYDLLLRRDTSDVARGAEMRLVVRVDKSNGLSRSLKLTTLANSPIESIEYLLDYPELGPIDIYSLGAPRTARIDDHVPGNELRRVLVGIRTGRNGFDAYRLLLHNGNLYRVYRKGDKWRLEFGQARIRSWNNMPPRFSNEYWEWYAQQVTFLPMALSNGKAIYRARISEPKPYSDELQKVEGWELRKKVRTKHGVGELAMCGYSWALPEFFAYPYVEVSGYPILAVDRGDGPEGTVFFAVGKSRYWSDPSKDYAVVRFQINAVANGVEPEITMTYELADFERTPLGMWYPRLVKQNTAGYKDQEGQPILMEQTTRFHVDFESELPEHLFEPK